MSHERAAIIETILHRRSIRKYAAEPVSHDDITQLLQAAMAAPSASNRQPWEFVVVTDPARLQKLRQGLVLGHYNAPVAIVVCGNKRRALPAFAQAFWIQDCSAAAQNIMLAATGLGLGSVWVGVHPIGPLVYHVARSLRLPRYVTPLGVIYIGHPAETKPPRTQYDQARIHWDVYDAERLDDDDKRNAVGLEESNLPNGR
jgi:nitroreductase